MISCGQTNNEIICDQAVPFPFLCPPSSPPDRSLTQEVMLSLPKLTKNQDHHITHRLTPSRGRIHFDTKSIPAFLENYALADCLKCPALKIRVQVNADEGLLQNIHVSRHVFKVDHANRV